MFSDVELFCVALIPDLTSDKQSKDFGFQTQNLNFSENFAQTNAPCDNQSQTDSAIWQSITSIVDDALVNWSNLNRFLRSVEPLITRTVENNVQQLNILKSILNVETAGQDDAQVRIIHRLKDRDQKYDLEVTSVDWNSTGNVVAACYGNFYHENWCTHKGWLSCWNLQRRTVDAEKSDWSYEFSSCLSCLTFHPSDPALLAVGAYSGEILLFNNNGDIICKTSTSHPKSITCISWSNSDVFACTSDGRIAVYGLAAGNKLDSPKSFFVPNKHHRLTGRSSRNGQKNAGAGISNLTLNKKRSTVLDHTFIVATDCGGVFLCDNEPNSRSTLEKRSANLESVSDFLDPVVNTFEEHIGPVTKVEFCPFSNDIFISCGCDGRLFIRDRNQFEPLKVLEVSVGALNSVAWSNGRPSTILCGNSHGELIFVNLFNENGYTSKIWHANSSLSSMNHPVEITDLSFNSSSGRTDWLAVGDSSGTLNILQIVDEMEYSSTDDLRLLDDILRKSH